MGEKQAISNNIQWALSDIKKNKKKGSHTFKIYIVARPRQ
jgi:hypothetical protein